MISLSLFLCCKNHLSASYRAARLSRNLQDFIYEAAMTKSGLADKGKRCVEKLSQHITLAISSLTNKLVQAVESEDNI
jgi:hypothetical protein